MFQNFTRVSDRFLVFHSEIPKLEMKSSYFLHRVKFSSAFCASELQVNCADWWKKELTSSTSLLIYAERLKVYVIDIFFFQWVTIIRSLSHPHCHFLL